jgi:hypothetical protein
MRNPKNEWENENATYEDFIGIFENPWDHDTEGVCSELVEWFDLCAQHDWVRGSRTDLPPNLREDEIIYPLDLMLEHHIPSHVHDIYRQGLKRCLAAYCSKYDLNKINLQHKTNKMHKVLPTQGYHFWHFENGNAHQTDRILVYTTYLRVPKEGGETEFRHQSKRVKPVVGRTLIWPAGFTHMHRGNPPLDGEKYYITGWFSVTPAETYFENTISLYNSHNE